MGEILGLGITHYPGLTPKVARPGSLRRTLQDPGLPEHLRTPAGWPEAMRQEWGDDEGRTFAAQHRDQLGAEMRKVRKVLDDFRPDFLLIWGDDQYENFREDLIPAYAVLAYDQVEVQPWKKRPEDGNFWGEPVDTTHTIVGHRQGAKYLTTRLIEEGFDVAYAYKPLHHPLGHAFLNSVMYLDWDRQGFDHRVVPFPINCYGRKVIAVKGGLESLEAPVKEEDLDPPSPTPTRCFDLGAACARVLKNSPYRVALIASSSWSHAFLTRKHWFIYPDTPADRVLYDALTSGNYHVWRNRSLAEVEDSGQHELLNWFCLVGAMAELGRKPNESTFVESNIMNSNKVVATFLP